MPSSSEHSDSDSDSSTSTTSSSSDSSSSSSSDSSETSKPQDVPPSKKSDKEKKQKLLDDSSSDEDESSGEEEGGASANAPTKSILKVNKKYAREFDQRKRREELLNARQAGENLGSDDDEDEDSSSEEEDEDGELMTPGMDLSILRTLKALKNKDETIYDKNARFFPAEDDDDSDDDDEEGKKKKHKPMKYKDVVREQVLEQMDAEERGEGDKGGDSDDGDGNAASRRREDEDGPASRFAYDDEQRELRAAFLKSTNSDGDDNDDNSDDDDDEGDDWMVKKSVSKADADRAQKLVESEISELEKLGTGDASVSDPRGEVGDGDKFLLDFIKNKRWVDKDLHDSDDDSDDDGNEERGIYRSKMNNGDDDDDDEDGHDSDASLDELEQMDAFESKYNFRFEEAAASAEAGESGAAYSVVGYARGGAHTTDTLRRKDETRKQKRLARNEKKAAERKAKEERLRRLKNAKREELEGRMKQVRQVVGTAEEGDADIDEAALMKLMEGDFDPDKFESIMSQAYGDDFYDKEDAEWKNDADVKQSLMRDETGAEGDIINEDTGDMYDEYNDDEEAGGDEDGDDEDLDFDPESPADFEEETGIEKKLRKKMEDELYKLDYEDIIGDMPTRFKYRKVEANRFGLAPQEILFAKDSTLKQFVSLKRMAPYSGGEEYLPGTKKRKRFRDIAKHDYEELMEAEPEAEAEHVEESTATEEAGDVDKPKKKRRRQKKKKKGADTTDTAAKENASEEKAEKKDKKKKDKQSSTDSPAATSDAKADAKKKRRQKKNKDGKSGSKKKKASKIAGVAESRLAAYGL